MDPVRCGVRRCTRLYEAACEKSLRAFAGRIQTPAAVSGRSPSTQEINNTTAAGQAKVLGSVWTARSARGTVIPEGTEVIVRAIEGVKIIVEELPAGTQARNTCSHRRFRVIRSALPAGTARRNGCAFPGGHAAVPADSADAAHRRRRKKFMWPLYVFLAFLLIVIIIVISNVKMVPQAYAYVMERFGAYSKTWSTGLHVKVPFIDRIAKRVSLKEQVIDFPPQPVITKDNATIQIDTVVYFQITDPMLYTYGVERPISAIENLSATTLRNIIGELELDASLTSRDIINTKIRQILDEATDAWGIKVNRVELKNIIPPPEIQNAMEKQMKAVREKRAVVTEAEGSRALSWWLRAKKESTILRAEAKKEARIREAEGEAEAILAVQRALADSLRMLNEAAPSDRVIALKSLEAFQKAADGKATKIIIPSEIQSLAGLATSVKELVANDVKPGTSVRIDKILCVGILFPDFLHEFRKIA